VNVESEVPQSGLRGPDAGGGDRRAGQTPHITASLGADQLFASLYAELHRMAESHLRSSGRDLAVSTTTLVHDMWLDMSGRTGLVFPDRARFMAYAARAMRAVVIDYARRARAQKRGGGAFDITLHPDVAGASDENAAELARLSDALDELARVDPSLAELVDLHFFCGFAFREIAELRDISERTVRRDWRKARVLLHQELR
jgi:RNA polymerase sigma factor (TIGR02999 family)